MKALSIRQPWAWLIGRSDLTEPAEPARAGRGALKTIENRAWHTRECGTILVHASQGMTSNEYFGIQQSCNRLGIELPPILLARRHLARGHHVLSRRCQSHEDRDEVRALAEAPRL